MWEHQLITKIIIVLAATILIAFGGCIEEKKVTQVPESLPAEALNASISDLTLLSGEENKPEINIESFSSIYMRDNEQVEEQYLFSWDNVPGNESYRLLGFLKKKSTYNWILQEMFMESPNWVENAQIIKSDENNTIRVFNVDHSIELKLESNRVILFADGRKHGFSEKTEIFRLLAKQENGKYNIYNREFQNKYKYNISERYFAVYDLSIKNSGSSNLSFKLDELHLRIGDKIFYTTTLESPGNHQLEVLEDLEKENKIEDKTLFPGQTIRGYVVFAVNSLYDRSFLLMYNTTPIASASFEKGIDALTAAELFNYSVAFGKPPYSYCRGTDLYEPKFDEFYENVGFYCDTWANWVNRSVFDSFEKADLDRMQRSVPDDIPLTKIVYALKVVPERNITMFPVKSRFDSYNFHIVDTDGVEITNKTSWHQGGIAVLNNQTYRFQPASVIDIPQTNFSNATVVQISFEGTYGWSLAMRLTYNNQDMILNDELNIIVARYTYSHFIT